VGRIVMLADLDYFYAQVEERRDPSLIGRPVVVCVYSGRTEDSGVVATANYVARGYGAKSGIPISLAKKRLAGTNAKFLPMDHDFYKQASDRVMAILKRNADEFEQVSIDEAYLDVSARATGFQEATTLARGIKDEVRASESLTLSIGVGPNKVIAKIASEMKKPDGLTIVKDGDTKAFLSPLPVERLVGIGKKTSERMGEMGIRTIGELAAFDQAVLVKEFGRALGAYFHKASNGEDEEPVHERGEKESISRIVTLKEDTKNPEKILDAAYRLCEETMVKVRDRRLLFRRVGIIAITTDLTIRMRDKSLTAPTDDLQIMKRTVRELLERYLAGNRQELRRVGVHVSGLVRRTEGQSQLTGFL